MAQEWADGRPAVNLRRCWPGSSTPPGLRAGVALAELIDDPQPDWELAADRLGHALREHRDLFPDKSTFSMDWYYPVLGGAVRGDAGRGCSRTAGTSSWCPGLGIRCVDTNPWVTGAETCELVLALDALGDRDRALRLFADMQHLRDDRRLATGPATATPTTSTGRSSTPPTPPPRSSSPPTRWATARPGSDIMRGATLPADFAEFGLECELPVSRRAVSGLARRPR